MAQAAAVDQVASQAAALSLDSSLPLWFKPELFTQPEFNAVAYVSDLKRYVPLETLSSELQAHLGALKNKLVEVINEDYNDFVSLSTKLVNVDAALSRMQAPLLDLQQRLESARQSVADRAGELHGGLARRQAVAAARALLELMQDTAHVVSKVDKLLEEVRAAESAGGGADSSPEALEARCRLLDRVASEVSRLQFYAAKGEELEFMRQLQPRIDGAAEALRSALDAALAATLASQSPVALGVCLHAYAAIARPQAAEAVVRSTLVAPVVRQAVSQHRSQSAAAAPASGAQLGALL